MRGLSNGCPPSQPLTEDLSILLGGHSPAGDVSKRARADGAPRREPREAKSTPKDTQKYIADPVADVAFTLWFTCAIRSPAPCPSQPAPLEPPTAVCSPYRMATPSSAYPQLTPSEIAVGLREVRSHPGRRPPQACSRPAPFPRTIHSAGVAELADALDSKSSARKGVGVQVPPPVLLTRQGLPTSLLGFCGRRLLGVVTQSVTPATHQGVLHRYWPAPDKSLSPEGTFRLVLRAAFAHERIGLLLVRMREGTCRSFPGASILHQR